MRLHIGVDIDDVLFGWYDRAHSLCMEAGITGGVVPTTWSPFVEYGCSEKAWWDVLAAGVRSGYLYSGEPIPGAPGALAELMDAGHQVHLVTARGFGEHGDMVREHTVAWLVDHEIPHHTLTFSTDKSVVRTDYFIDDNAHNIADVCAAGSRGFLNTRPWNAHVEHTDRVDHVAEFAATILGEPALV